MAVRSGKGWSRRALLTGVLGLATYPFWPVSCFADQAAQERRVGAKVANYDDLIAVAETLSRNPYEERPLTGSDGLRNMTPAEFTRIKFRGDAALWRGQSEYEVHMIKPGVYANRLVDLNTIQNSQVTPLPYDPSVFDLSGLENPDALREAGGYSGFKVVYPLHEEHFWKDELVVFHGASYFRFLGRHQQYGLSARGIALNTGMPEPEEFPDFREFWLKGVPGQGEALSVLALLDSPSLTGAYEFRIEPDDESRVEVKARLFPRRDIEKLGCAPLTSMYITGDTERVGRDQVAFPKMHDSDGLQIVTKDGQQIWRPLVRRRGVQLTQHFVDSPQGFGLLQREKREIVYANPEKRYHRRPGYWVTPKMDWGKGHVELLEIGSTDEDFDNIGAYWVPETPVKAGVPIDLAYSIDSVDRLVERDTSPAVSGLGHISILDRARDPSYLRARVRFADGPDDQSLADRVEEENLSVRVESRFGMAGATEIDLLENGEIEVRFNFMADNPERAEVAVTLLENNNPISETWSYLWSA